MHAVPPQPERLGQFEIVATLSSGSMGPVYRAVDSSKRSVVLKTIPKTLLESYGAPAVARFQNEARSATCLQHPGIVNVYGYGEDAGLAFVVMEWVDGNDLRGRVRVPLPDAASLLAQLLEALDYAHDQGVVHRAIKPSNLFLTKSGEVRIAGFGVARFDPGKPDYMSPEQFMGLPIDRRTDVFSAGVIFYELLTGVNPFEGPHSHLVDRVCNDRERAPSSVNVDLPHGFDPVSARSLAKAVFDRYPTARAFGKDIRIAFEAACHAPLSRAVSSETVALLAAPWAQAKVSPSINPRSKDESNPRFTGAGLMWDESKLRTIERQLANYMGPLARIIVKEAAAKTSDTDRLYTLAAESLKSEEDRKAFLAHRFEGVKDGVKRDASSEIQRARSAEPAAVTPIAAPPIERAHAPEAKSQGNSSVKPTFQPPAKVDAIPNLKPPSKVDPKSEVKVEQKKTPVKPADPVSDIEKILGKQPENLAGYLRDTPGQVEEVVHAFVGCVEAVVAVRAANYKNIALVPQNICFDRLGKATLQVSQSSVAHGTSDTVGKPRYAVPEIFAEKSNVDDSTIAAAHVYALGVMFYEILLGRKLFEKTFAGQRTDLDWLRWHADLEAKAPPLKSLLPGTPAALSDLLESMMEKHVEKRPATLDVVLTRLRSIALRANNTIVLRKPTPPAKAPTPAPTPVSTQTKSGSGTGLVAFLLILALVLAAGGFVAWQYPDLVHDILSRFNHSSQTPQP